MTATYHEPTAPDTARGQALVSLLRRTARGDVAAGWRLAAKVPRLPANLAARRRGFTLVELLVVIGILVVLAGIALPVFRNAIKDQKTAQAARQVITYMEAARSRAIASKGRVGVLISRRGTGDAVQRSYSIQLQLSVAYPPYSGESDSARALLYHHDEPGAAGVANAALFDPAENTLLEKARLDIAQGRGGLAPIRAGDPIQFGESGRTVPIGGIERYRSSGPTDPVVPTPAPKDWIKVRFDPRGRIPSPGAVPMHDFPSSLMSVSGTRLSDYKIYRDPVPSAASPLSMLRGMAIDLNYSGIGRDGAQFSPMVIHPTLWDSDSAVDFHSVLLMFGPDGRIDFCSSGTASGSGVSWADYRPTGLLYFCLGRADGVFADPAMLFSDTPRERANIMDPESIWIVVNPFNGNMFAAPAAAITAPDSSLPIATQLGLAVRQSRQFAFEADELTSL